MMDSEVKRAFVWFQSSGAETFAAVIDRGPKDAVTQDLSAYKKREGP